MQNQINTRGNKKKSENLALFYQCAGSDYLKSSFISGLPQCLQY